MWRLDVENEAGQRPGLGNDGWSYERTEAPAAVHSAMR